MKLPFDSEGGRDIRNLRRVALRGTAGLLRVYCGCTAGYCGCTAGVLRGTAGALRRKATEGMPPLRSVG